MLCYHVIFWYSANAVRTFKPVRYDPVERKLMTSDKNNDKKFAFITQETVVDYRSVEVRWPVLPLVTQARLFLVLFAGLTSVGLP